MTKDKKNKDYLDQIYYSFAEIALKEGDTLSAIKYFKTFNKNQPHQYQTKSHFFSQTCQHILRSKRL